MPKTVSNTLLKDVFLISNPGENLVHDKKQACIGVAMVDQKTQTINVILDAIPLTGKIQIRDRQILSNQKRKVI